jgi:hypothetical protein
LCAAAVPILAVFFIANALAAGTTTIQDNNAIELDGNATAGNGHSAVPPVPDALDWQNVYCSTSPTPAGCSGVAPDGATVRAFVNDPVNSNTTDDIFTTGSSKDPNAVGGWLWTTSKPQAKDDLEHAFAAEYASAKVCGDSALTMNCVNHQLLFFGADRYSNSGNSDLGFWFFKGQVSKTAAGGFNGHHENGDLLVLSTFLTGGVVPQVAVYQWTCPASDTAAQCDTPQSSTNPNGGVLTLVNQNLNGADCVNGVDTHNNPVPATFGDFCATVNTANNVPSPWPFTEKSSDGAYVTANHFGAGTFFEGGLDLTNLGFGNTCFSTFLAETRSSASTTATLSDFVTGTFKRCSASITTSQSASAAVSPGAKVTDMATVTGIGPTTPPFPTSSTDPSVSGAPGTPVTFAYCSSATTITSCSGLSTTPLGTANLSNSSPQGVSTATSSALDTTGKSPGYYCFTASWGGDQNYQATISDDGSVGTPGGNTECFHLLQIPTTTVTTPSDGSGNPLSGGAQTFDTTIYDKAVVTANQSGEGRPTGTVSFFVCDPNHTTTDATGTYCAAGDGTAVTGNPVSLTADSGNTLASDALSGGVEANIAGKWCFRATYTPDTTAFLTSDENNPTDECVVINQAPTTTKTTPVDSKGNPIGSTITLTMSGGVNVYDQALITGVPNGGNPTGTVDFSICGPQAGGCDASDPTSTGYAKFDTGEPVGSFATIQGNPTGTAMSKARLITVVGEYCFYAKYMSTNGNYTGSDDPNDSTECFTVKDTSSEMSTQTWLPNDSATFTTAGGNNLNGTVKFTLFSDATCGTSGGIDLYHKSITLTNAAPGDQESTSNSGATVSTSQSVSWLVTFTSTDPDVASSQHCERTDLTINNNP